MLNEFLDYSPLGLQLYFKDKNIKIMSSKKIENYTIDWCRKSRSTDQIIDKIEELIRRKKILIGYFENNGMFSYIKQKLGLDEDRSEYEGLLGCYESKLNTIWIILDHNTTIFGKAIKEIPSIITHELCHMIASEDTNNFLRYTTGPYLLPFYKEFLTTIEPKIGKLKKGRMKSFVRDLCIITDSRDYTGSWFSDATSLYSELFSDAGIQNSRQLAKALTSIYLTSKDGKKSHYPLFYRKVSKSLYSAYDILGYNTRNITYAYQEIIFPSEIVCRMNEFKPSNYVKAMINNLNI
jgi:hypothetical protein